MKYLDRFLGGLIWAVCFVLINNLFGTMYAIGYLGFGYGVLGCWISEHERKQNPG